MRAPISAPLISESRTSIRRTSIIGNVIVSGPLRSVTDVGEDETTEPFSSWPPVVVTQMISPGRTTGFATAEPCAAAGSSYTAASSITPIPKSAHRYPVRYANERCLIPGVSSVISNRARFRESRGR